MWQRCPVAYLRRRSSSPFWTIIHRDLSTGRWIQLTTRYRIDDPKDCEKAVREAAKKSTEEAIVRPSRGENFVEWVEDYIDQHYAQKVTIRRAHYFWRTLRVFMFEHGIHHPKQVKYEHAAQFMDWRQNDTGDRAGHNTARMEVKFWSFLMSEAVRREYADRNAIALARIEIKAAKPKREITEEEIVLIREEFKKEDPWMATSFELLINLGIRFAESRIHSSRIDLKRHVIELTDSKRQATDPRKYFSVPISDQLAAYLATIRWYDNFTLPELTRPMNRNFNRAIARAVEGVTSHCCRVSFISRCHRSGLGEHEAMRLVNHSTRMVHRVYSKLNVEDARNAMMRLPLPPPAEPQQRPSRRSSGQGKSAPTGASSSSRKKGIRAF